VSWSWEEICGGEEEEEEEEEEEKRTNERMNVERKKADASDGYLVSM
jgi:uncharacterized protein YkwD